MTTRATRASKRQPFRERSPSSAASRSKNNNSKKRVQRRRSRQIGDDVAIYIQEKKSKAGKLHRAKVDIKTGGISFTPGNRKTPISYDCHRHTLVEKTPDGDEVEVDLDTDGDKENLKHGSDSEMEISSKNTRIERAADMKKKSHRRKAIKPYAESAGDESDDESDFEEAPVKKVKKTKKTTAKATARDTERRNTTETAELLVDENDCEEVLNEPAARERTSTFSSPIVKSNWEDHQSDWRCTGAIDY